MGNARTKFLLTLSLAMSVFSMMSAAQAQEAPAGLYGGIGFGYSNQKTKITNTSPALNFKFSDDDEVFNAVLGYDFNLGNGWLAGAEAGLDISAYGASITGLGGFGFDTPDYQLNLSGRVGHMFGERFLGYVKASYSHLFIDGISDFDGLGIGGGGEFRLTDKWWLRTEYRYTDFERNSLRSFTIGANPDVSLSSHQATLSAVFRF